MNLSYFLFSAFLMKALAGEESYSPCRVYGVNGFYRLIRLITRTERHPPIMCKTGKEWASERDDSF